LTPETVSTSPGDSSLLSKTTSHGTNVSYGSHSIAESQNTRRSSSQNTLARTEAAAEELLALRYPPSEAIVVPETYSASEISPQLQTVAENAFEIRPYDGIFLPGSTYQELHTTLRNHIIESTKADGRFRYDISYISQDLEIPMMSKVEKILTMIAFCQQGHLHVSL
jgi:hypothetical protein